METIVTGWNKFHGTWFARAYATTAAGGGRVAGPYGFISAESDTSAAEAVERATEAALVEARKYDDRPRNVIHRGRVNRIMFDNWKF